MRQGEILLTSQLSSMQLERIAYFESHSGNHIVAPAAKADSSCLVGTRELDWASWFFSPEDALGLFRWSQNNSTYRIYSINLKEPKLFSLVFMLLWYVLSSFQYILNSATWLLYCLVYVKNYANTCIITSPSLYNWVFKFPPFARLA